MTNGSGVMTEVAHGTEDYVLTSTGTGTAPTWQEAESGGGSGDVSAASSFGTDNVLIRSNGTAKGVQHTGITIADTTNNMSGVGTIGSGVITATGTCVFTNLDISGDVDVDGTLETDALSIGSTTVSATAAELNLIDGSSANTIVNSKAVIYGSSGQVNATTLQIAGSNVNATAAEINVLASATAGTSVASKAMVTDSNADFEMQDSDKMRFGNGADMDIYHDSSNSYITNKTGALKIATETSGIAVTIGHGTSEVSIADNLNIAGDVVAAETATIKTLNVDSGGISCTGPITVGVNDNGKDVKFFGETAGAYMLWDESADDLKLVGAAGMTIASDLDVDGTTNLDAVDIDGAVDMASTLGVTGVITADAGIDVDNFNIDGTTIALSSGDMTLSADGGDIVFDAGGDSEFHFQDDASTRATLFAKTSSGTDFGSGVSHAHGSCLHLKSGNVNADRGGMLVLHETSAGGGGTHMTAFRCADTLAADLVYILPTTAPTADQVLACTAVNSSPTDYTLAWADDATGGGGGGGDVVDDTSPQLGGTLDCNSQLIDFNGLADGLVLDADGDTTISSPTDDQIDFEVAGADQISLVDGKLYPTTHNDVSLGNQASVLGFKDIACVTYYGTETATSPNSFVAGATADSTIMNFLGEQHQNTSYGGIITTNRTSPSDSSVKNSIADNTIGLSLINQLQPKSYKYNSDYLEATEFSDMTYYGMIAQDVQALDSSYVQTIEDPRNPDDTLITYSKEFSSLVHNALLVAVKELSTKNDALEARIAALEAA